MGGTRKAAAKQVLVVGDRRRAGVLAAVERHRAFLERSVDLVAVDLDDGVDLAREKADLVLVFGGDGSILHVARRLGLNPVPVLGVNYGRFGYLADVEPDELEQGLTRWLSGAFSVVPRLRLAVRVRRAGAVVDEALALNDVVVARDQVGRMVDVDVRVNGRTALGVSGDGLIVATSTGSTAHALSAGGPIVEPSVDALVLVPIAPQSLSYRALVLPATHRLELVLDATRHPGSVTVDGRAGPPLAIGDVVEVEDAKSPLHLVHVSSSSFYDALRVKLGWTGRPRYLAPNGGRAGAPPEPPAADSQGLRGRDPARRPGRAPGAAKDGGPR
jgi:NAD+ kinase